MEKSHKAVVAAIEARQKEEETRMKTLVEELEGEVQELRKATAEPGSEILLTADQSGDMEDVAVVRLLMVRTGGDSSGVIVIFAGLLSCRTRFPPWTSLR